MPLRFFTIPVFHPRDAERELNNYLASHRIVSTTRQFVADGQGSVWAICVDAIVKGSKRVLRDGALINHAQNAGSAQRNANDPGKRDIINNIGFRLAPARIGARVGTRSDVQRCQGKLSEQTVFRTVTTHRRGEKPRPRGALVGLIGDQGPNARRRGDFFARLV